MTTTDISDVHTVPTSSKVAAQVEESTGSVIVPGRINELSNMNLKVVYCVLKLSILLKTSESRQGLVRTL